jgi:hypothetical protein
MRDIKSDWKRWSRTERIGVMTFVIIVSVVYGSSVFGELAGVWAFKTVFLQESTAIERSASHGSDGTQ